jgi:hypothetical protein
MATQGRGKKLPAKTRLPSSDFYIPPIRLDVAPVRKPIGEEIMGWIAACVLVALLLPVMGMLYIDILEAKNETKAQVEKIEKLRRQIEQKERGKDK